MRVYFLGTGAGVPSKQRNTQSMVFSFMQELKECWMLDCGEATQHKIMHTTIRPSKITKIFISHLHGDHILGLIGFLSSRNFLLKQNKNNLTIFGPKGIKEFVEFNMRITQVTLNYKINFVEYEDERNIIYENDKVQVEIVPLIHTIQSYAFKIIFKNKKGALKVDKLKEIGIMPGAFYRNIKEQAYFEYNGISYNSADFLEEERQGKIITIIPDTVNFSSLADFVKESDILISECTYLKEEELELAQKHKHMNITDIYDFVNQEQFDRIYLTHISSRYAKEEIIRIQKTLEEKNILIANDLDEYEL